MEEKSKKNTFYITTAIAYANGAPHMGYAYEVVFSDIIARYFRGQGKDVFFLTGTDEHGEKIIRTAMQRLMGPQAFVDANVAKFKEFAEKLSISYDKFIRTSDKNEHWPGAQALWTKLLAAGDIYKDVYKGLYCVGCEAFITEKDLTDGKCPNHNTPPEYIEEENYFFRLSRYTNILKEKVNAGEIEILPSARRNEICALFEEGLQDISISRPEGDIPWGVPVPNERGQIMYVWFEALINYISALGYGRKDCDNFNTFWPADVHVIGKDILRFHAAIWPAMLISAGLALPKKILVHGFITSGGKKMSKSLGNVVDPLAFAERHGAEALRYYLAREISPLEDSDFTEEHFVEVYNAHLANGLGNLVSRTLKMSQKYFDGRVSRVLDVDMPLKRRFESIVDVEELEGFSVYYLVQQNILPKYKKHMKALHIHRATDEIWRLLGELDGYITDYEPFKLIKEDKSRTENIIWNVLYGLYFTAQMLTPIMPKTAETMLRILGASVDDSGTPVSFKTDVLKQPLFLRK